MQCRAVASWRQPLDLYVGRCLLADERGLTRSCPIPISKFRSDDLNAPRDVVAKIGSAIESAEDVKAARVPVLVGALLTGLSIGLLNVVRKLLGLSSIALIMMACGLAVVIALLALSLHGQRIASAHARMLSKVCNERKRCAFCLYQLGDLDPPDDAQSPNERKCPECGATWTLN